MSTKARKKTLPKAPALPAPVVSAIPPVESGIFAAYRDAANLAKENLTTVTAANAALTEGIERIGLELVGITRGTLESAAVTGAALLDARSLAEVAALNGDFARACLDRLIAGAVRLSQLGFAAASEAYEPFGARMEQTFSLRARSLAA
jgi:hypothetical protein